MSDRYGLPPATADTIRPHDIIDRLRPDSWVAPPGGFLEIREYGMMPRTDGRYQVLGMRSEAGFVMDGYTCWHEHDVDQVGYIISGYAVWEYDGLGKITFGAGDALYESKNMRHRPVEMSPGCEMVVFLTPGGLGTTYHVVDEATGTFTPHYVGWGATMPPEAAAQMKMAPRKDV
ncbi:cupin domain-containing protein [Plantactinospora sp. WMMB334]|uniref:cupin domain-containing protein n=1 Tax=Plantactinospora sp. WMMB334 TaxID=3404119 RepID=UPI003B947444